jgi:hypothetical protein
VTQLKPHRHDPAFSENTMTTTTTAAPAKKAPAKKAPAKKPVGYWTARKRSVYLYVARAICEKYAPQATSVIDIGSHATPTLEWHRPHAKKLVSLDLVKPYAAEGVESLTQDFLDYAPSERFELATCLQVLEHVPRAEEFAKRLLEVAKVLVVSVPYNWPEGNCKYHIHDPVNEDKMLEWFGREPDFSYVARELNNVHRLIQVYKQKAS